jgi:histidinol dehydrogenase
MSGVAGGVDRAPAWLAIAVRGVLSELTSVERGLLLDRRTREEPGVRDAVRQIVADVCARGDAALRDMARDYDGVELSDLEVPRARWDAAVDALSAPVRDALERAASNLERFHAAGLPGDVTLETEPGVSLTRRFAPVDRAGVYAPGGLAAYPSSVLMGAVAARAAGVREVVVCSPPGPTGAPPQAVLAAAAIAGASRLFAVGGAGAVAAMAFGTESVPRCAAVVGPGNRWVTEAKRQVAGEVIIDSPAGPSEVLVVAESGASAQLIAAELLAQAEHDPDAAVAFVTPSGLLLDAVELELEAQVAGAPRRDVIESALAGRGALLLARDLDEALDFAEAYAAEHLALYTKSPERDALRVPSAGTVCLGDPSSVVFGDYLTGANHVLPTAGWARSRSCLSALTFLRSWNVQQLTAEAASRLSLATEALALEEGLPSHAAAARLRGVR